MVDDVRTALPLSAQRPRLKIPERIAREIVGWISDGTLHPGDRLPSEAALIDHFDVSRGSMREALRVLENAGVLSLTSGRGGGPVVQPTGVQAFAAMSTLYLELLGATYRELLEVRVLTEPILASRAATRRADADLEALRGDLDAMAAAIDDLGPFADAEIAFHMHLAVASGNRALALYIGASAVVFGEHFRQLLDSATVTRQAQISLKSLQRVYDAVAKGEHAAAQRRMARYVNAYLEIFDPDFADVLDTSVTWQTT
jgi:GntR family transcriptional repressor for pyruvate dehydrogenase complex